MGLGGRMFDGLFKALIVIGVAIGITLCGLIWALWWLMSHLNIEWVS